VKTVENAENAVVRDLAELAQKVHLSVQRR